MLFNYNTYNTALLSTKVVAAFPGNLIFENDLVF